VRIIVLMVIIISLGFRSYLGSPKLFIVVYFHFTVYFILPPSVKTLPKVHIVCKGHRFDRDWTSLPVRHNDCVPPHPAHFPLGQVLIQINIVKRTKLTVRHVRILQ